MRKSILKGNSVRVSYFLVFLVIAVSLYLQYQSRVFLSYVDYGVRYNKYLNELEYRNSNGIHINENVKIDSLKDIAFTAIEKSDPIESFKTDGFVTGGVSLLLGLLIVGSASKAEEEENEEEDEG